jgi:hypothetical protein
LCKSPPSGTKKNDHPQVAVFCVMALIYGA